MPNKPVIDADILIVGGTAAGCAAAIAAARGGSRVVVLEPTSSIGGTTANGVHCFDTGTLQALSGVAEEFINRVLRHYANAGLEHPMLKSKSDVFWEFHVAEGIWREMIAEYKNIQFINRAVAVDVTMKSERLIDEVLWEPAVDAIGNPAAHPMLTPNRVRAKLIIDATYEGDVAAWAGAPYDFGREARSPGEPHAGVIHTTTHERHISANGYLPSTILPGSTGEADDSIMAFTCRLSLRYRPTEYEAHLIRTRPDGYDASRYSWKPGTVTDKGDIQFGGGSLIPSLFGKMLTNQRYKGDDLLSGTRDYILAHPRDRTAIRKRFFDHVLGFLYYIQNEGGMPQIGLSEDEYADNHNLPHSLYVRAGRRFRGRTRMTEMEVNPYLTGPGPRPPRQTDSIAIGDWAIESRRCSDEISPQTNTYDGSMFIRALRAPYQVPFGCLVPQRVDNLLVTTTVSATHVAFCALRVEAVWTETGSAAGVAASVALSKGCALADVPVYAIQQAMLDANCKLTYFEDVETSHREFVGIQWLALKGFLPEDRFYRFFPDNSATWGDLVEASVRAFELPISVTGFHFEGIDPGHPAFRYAETLYDVASRAGVALFPNMRNPVIDEPADHLRPELRSRWLNLETDVAVTGQQAVAFLTRLNEAIGRPSRSPVNSDLAQSRPLTRGELASMLMKFAQN
jgi:hypothetical protein